MELELMYGKSWPKITCWTVGFSPWRVQPRWIFQQAGHDQRVSDFIHAKFMVMKKRVLQLEKCEGEPWKWSEMMVMKPLAMIYLGILQIKLDMSCFFVLKSPPFGGWTDCLESQHKYGEHKAGISSTSNGFPKQMPKCRIWFSFASISHSKSGLEQWLFHNFPSFHRLFHDQRWPQTDA